MLPTITSPDVNVTLSNITFLMIFAVFLSTVVNTVNKLQFYLYICCFTAKAVWHDDASVLYHLSKFHEDRSKSLLLAYRDFCDFQDGGRSRRGFQKFKMLSVDPL